MKKTILLVTILMLTALLSVSAFAQSSFTPCDGDGDCTNGETCEVYDGYDGTVCGRDGCEYDQDCGEGQRCVEGECERVVNPGDCGVVGGFLVPDYSNDVRCKLRVWNGIGDNFPCIRDDLFNPNEFEGLRRILRGIANDQSENIPALERRTLRAIAGDEEGIPRKFRQFKRRCTGGGPFVTDGYGGQVRMTAKRYIYCKQLLADIKKELGEAAKITWYSTQSSFVVQILEDVQENVDHILAKFDERARGKLRVHCDESCDADVELINGPYEPIPGEPDELGLTTGITIKTILTHEAVSAYVTVKTDNCRVIAGNGCVFVNQFEGIGQNPKCFRVFKCRHMGRMNTDQSNYMATAVVNSAECGLENDINPSNNFARISGVDMQSTGPTGAFVAGAGVGSSTGTLVAVGALALVVIGALLFLRKKQ